MSQPQEVQNDQRFRGYRSTGVSSPRRPPVGICWHWGKDPHGNRSPVWYWRPRDRAKASDCNTMFFLEPRWHSSCSTEERKLETKL
jgi:hypothetical protein